MQSNRLSGGLGMIRARRVCEYPGSWSGMSSWYVSGRTFVGRFISAVS
uniref:Unclassified n=1 Tax=Fusarium clavum TaxID=2594811 RepID=W1IBD0_9HYPO|nr:unclassified [Fusarium clavum]CEF82633.1 unclassified [Fusarium clavum]